MNYTAQSLRALWVKFFESKNHLYVKPASLIPVNDDSLLWINSGVATLKNYFTGQETPPSKRLVNVQKVLRTSDIENVGVTSRHLTFFEMLGNFSIGDYFSEEAIAWGWEFLTSKEYLGLDKNKLFITVYEEDLTSKNIWMKLGVSENHIILGSKKTNFWDMGQGPCGPNTEIYFDRGTAFDLENKGIELLKKDIENDRYLEVWNIVLSQFNNDGKNNYTPLPNKNIDTGAGLERFLIVLNNVNNVYETDYFSKVIKHLEKLIPVKYISKQINIEKPVETYSNQAFRVIADHTRALIMAMSDGVSLSNKGRGYVLRKLARRMFVYGARINLKQEHYESIFKIAFNLIKDSYSHQSNIFQDIIADINKHQEKITTSLIEEFIQFSSVLKNGLAILDAEVNKKVKSLDSKLVFNLFETYGFPVELTEEYASLHKISIDLKAVNKLIEEHAKISKADKSFSAFNNANPVFDNLNINPTEFTGYQEDTQVATIQAIVHEDNVVTSLEVKARRFIVITDKSCLYAEAGGQIGDSGTITNKGLKVNVITTQKGPKELYLHYCEGIDGVINLNDTVVIKLDKKRRLKVEANHSATHLLNYLLINKVNKNITQAGSLVTDDYLRFDINTEQNITDEQFYLVGATLNQIINENHKTIFSEESLDAVKAKGKAIMNFKEKYKDKVRVITFNDDIAELCGGTHIKSTKEIGKFQIVETDKKGKGVIRIKAVTGKKVDVLINSYFSIITKNCVFLNKLNAKFKKEINAFNKYCSLTKEKEHEKQLAIMQSFSKAMTNYLINAKKLLKLKTTVTKPKALCDIKNLKLLNQIEKAHRLIDLNNSLITVEDFKSKVNSDLETINFVRKFKAEPIVCDGKILMLTKLSANTKLLNQTFSNGLVYASSAIGTRKMDGWITFIQKQEKDYMITIYWNDFKEPNWKPLVQNFFNSPNINAKWFNSANTRVLNGSIQFKTETIEKFFKKIDAKN